MSEIDKLGEINVVMGNRNTVGDIGHKVTIQYGHKPELVEDGPIEGHDLGDGRVKWVMPMRVTSPASSLELAATDGALSIHVTRPPRNGIVTNMMTDVCKRPIEGGQYMSFSNPSGSYWIVAIAPKGARPVLSWQLHP